MQTTIEAINRIKAASGTKEKGVILAEYSEDSHVAQYLQFVYDLTKFTYHIGDADRVFDEVSCVGQYRAEIKDMQLIVETLNERRLTGNDAIFWLRDLLELYDAESQALVRILLERDLRVGMAAKSINKAMGPIITIEPYMRCSLPKTKGVSLKDWDWAAGQYVQTKYDAMFANMDIGAGNIVSMSTRQGNKMPEYILQQFDVSGFIETGIIRLNGELIVMQDGVYLPREESNGVVNSLMAGGELEANQKLVYVTWDALPLQNARAGSYTKPYHERFEWLKDRLQSVNQVNLRAAKTEVVYSLKAAYQFYRDRLSEGEEGAILKNRLAIWIDGDSKEQIKFKVAKELDVRIIGYKPGKGKFKGLVGSIQVESECGRVRFGVSGMSNEVRQYITDNQDRLLGTIITVLGNGVQDKYGEEGFASVYLPRFSDFRPDKSTGDTMQRMIEIFDDISEEDFE